MKSNHTLIFVAVFLAFTVTTMAMDTKNHIMALQKSFLGSTTAEHDAAMNQLAQHLGLSEKQREEHLTLLPITGIVLTRNLPQGAYEKLEQVESMQSEPRFKESRSFLKKSEMSSEMNALMTALLAVEKDQVHHFSHDQEHDHEGHHKSHHESKNQHNSKTRIVDAHWEHRAVVSRSALDQQNQENINANVIPGLREIAPLNIAVELDIDVFVLDCGIHQVGMTRQSLVDTLARGGENYQALKAVLAGHGIADTTHGTTAPDAGCMHGTQVAEKIVDPIYGFGANVKLHDVQIIYSTNEFQFYEQTGGKKWREDAVNPPPTVGDSHLNLVTWTSSFAQGVEWTIKKVEALTTAGKPSLIHTSTFDKPASRVRTTLTDALAATKALVTLAAGNQEKLATDLGGQLHFIANGITVGNVERDGGNRWIREEDSNWGPNVDILAPGTDLLMCGDATCTTDATETGTSYSSPYFAGLAATVVATNPKLKFDPAYAKAVLLALATQGEVKEDFGTIGVKIPNNLMMWHGLTVAKKAAFQQCIADSNAGTVGQCFTDNNVLT